MDVVWDVDSWAPTVCPSDTKLIKWNIPEDTKVRPMIVDLSRRCLRVTESPYDARAWFARSSLLTRLGYPELGAGDAYKALLLVRAICRETAGKPEQEWPVAVADLISSTEDSLRQCDHQVLHDELPGDLSRPNHLALAQLDQAVLRSLIEALMLCSDAFSALNMCKAAAARHPENSWFCRTFKWLQCRFKEKRRAFTKMRPQMSSEDELQYQIRSGATVRRIYPWMTPQQYKRGSEVIGSVLDEFSKSSANCNIRASPVRKSIPETTGLTTLKRGDVIGVFAARDILKCETVLVDETGLGVANRTDLCDHCCLSLQGMKAIELSCCDAVFCSAKCAEFAVARYHSQLCGKDFFSFENDTAKTNFKVTAIEMLLFIRMLAAIRQENTSHPLKANVISRLTMLSEGWEPTEFSLSSCIYEPMMIAQTFGINIFENSNYDTWVLLTILYRIRSNGGFQPIENGVVGSLSLLHCFFNHHCSPNVHYGMLDTDQTDSESPCTRKIMVASRDIKKDEELFVSYIPNSLFQTTQQRRHSLKPWIGADCMCSRCVQEGDGGELPEHIRDRR